MGAAAVENGKLAFCLTESRDDEIDILDQGVNGLVEFQFREFGERLTAHWIGVWGLAVLLGNADFGMDSRN